MNVYEVHYTVKRKFGPPGGKQRDVEEGRKDRLAAEHVLAAIEILKAGVPKLAKILSVNLITNLTFGAKESSTIEEFLEP